MLLFSTSYVDEFLLDCSREVDYSLYLHNFLNLIVKTLRIDELKLKCNFIDLNFLMNER